MNKLQLMDLIGSKELTHHCTILFELSKEVIILGRYKYQDF